MAEEHPSVIAARFIQKWYNPKYSNKRYNRKLISCISRYREIEPNNMIEESIMHIYSLYCEIPDLTSIPYHLKKFIKFLFRYHQDVLTFKYLIRTDMDDDEVVNIVNMMMEFSIVFGFYFMPKRPLCIIQHFNSIDRMNFKLILYILDNKLDIMSDQLFYKISQKFYKYSPFANDIKLIIEHYPLDKYFKYVETWKTKNLTNWWVKPRNHIEGTRLSPREHLNSLIMTRVISIIKIYPRNIEYSERALRIFSELYKNSQTFLKSKHAIICLVELIDVTQKNYNYTNCLQYIAPMISFMDLNDYNFDDLIKFMRDRGSYTRIIRSFDKRTDKYCNLRNHMYVCAKKYIPFGVRIHISKFL